MQVQDRTAIIGIVIGLAWGALTMAGPLAFPGAPIWLWQLSFAAAGVVVVGGIILIAYDFGVRPRLIGQTKLDPFLWTAAAAFIVEILSLGIYMARVPQMVTAGVPGGVLAPISEAVALVKDIRIETRKLTDSNSPLIIAHAEIVSPSSRLRAFIDYSLYIADSDQWAAPARIPVAIIKDPFRGQRIGFSVLHRSPYTDAGSNKLAWNYLWGDPGRPLSQNNPYMPSIKSRTRLVFESADGKEQYYNLTIVSPQKLETGMELQVVTQADDWH